MADLARLGSRARVLRFLEQILHPRPESVPRLPFLARELLQSLGFAHAGQVGVLLPVPEGLGDGAVGLGRAGLEEPGPGGEFELQPVEGLLAELGLGGVAGSGIVDRFAAACKSGGTGSVVAVLSLA